MSRRVKNTSVPGLAHNRFVTVQSSLRQHLTCTAYQEVPLDQTFSHTVPADKFSVCSDPSQAKQSFYHFSSEDIEKTRNVSFSHQNYTGKVTLVVNLASF